MGGIGLIGSGVGIGKCLVPEIEETELLLFEQVESTKLGFAELIGDGTEGRGRDAGGEEEGFDVGGEKEDEDE